MNEASRAHTRNDLAGIARAFATSGLGAISGVLTGIVVFGMLARSSHPEEFGIYNLAFQCASYMVIFQLGLDYAAARQIALHGANEEIDKQRTVFDFLKRFNSRISCGILAFGLVSFIISNFSIESNTKLLFELVAMFSCSTAINFISRPYSALLIGLKQQSYLNILNLIRSLSSAVFSIILIDAGFALYSVPISEIVTFGLYFFLVKILAKKKSGKTLWSRNYEENSEAKRKVVSFSAIAVVSGLCWTVESGSDIPVLTALEGAAIAAAFAVCWAPAALIFTLATRLTDSASPYLAASSVGPEAYQTSVFRNILFLSAYLGIGAAVGIHALGESFLYIWVGKDYFDGIRSNQIVDLISILIALRILGNAIGTYLLMCGSELIVLKSSVLQALLKIILLVVLVQLFGLTGAFWASILCSFFQFSFLSLVSLRRGLVDLGSLLIVLLMGLIACFLILILGNDEVTINIVTFGFKALKVSIALLLFLALTIGFLRLFYGRIFAT